VAIAEFLDRLDVVTRRGPVGEDSRLRAAWGWAPGILLAIELGYVPRGRIRATYLLDAACEVGWLLAWCRTSRMAR
jgi:hypothetical protein